MLKVGLTGEAGAGKSFIAGILKDRFNVPVIDSDGVTKELMMPNHPVFSEVIREFGEEYLDESGYIDRSKLAGLVFNDNEKLEKLNELTHPATIAEILRQIHLLEQNRCQIVVIESALALDANYRSFCDEFWYVHAPEPDRKKRLILTRGWSETKADSVIASQRNERFYREHCIEVIENPLDMSEEQLFIQIKSIINKKIS